MSPEANTIGGRTWRHALFGAVLTAAASVAVFCWTLLLVFFLLAHTFNRLTSGPPAFHVAAVVVAVATASATAGVIARRRYGPQCRAVGLAGAALASGALALMAWAGMPWLLLMRRAGLPGAVWVPLCLAALGGVSAICSVRSRNGHRNSAGSMQDGACLTQVSDLGRLRVHSAVLLGVWLTGGFLTYTLPVYLLLTAGALAFVLGGGSADRPPSQVRFWHNRALLVPGIVLLVIPLRDMALLLQGVRVGGYAAPTYSFFTAISSQLGVIGAVVLSLGAALAYVLASPDSNTTGRWHPRRLSRGGLLMMALVPLVFVSVEFQRLPLMLMLLLYSYLLFANGFNLRRFLVWTVILATWVPFVGLAQYGWHYMARLRATSALPPFWFYDVGSSDPFLWHDSLGTSLAVTLLLAYGLLRTTRRAIDRRLLQWAMALLFITFVLTFARGAWISLMVAAVIGVVLIGGRKRWWAPALVIAVALGLGLAQATGAVALQRVFDRGATTALRVRTVITAWEVVKQHPLFGIAPMEWEQLQLERVGMSTTGFGGMWPGCLQVPVEGGIVGTTALIVMLSALGLKLRRAIVTAPSPEDQLLIKCALLAMIALAVNNCFDVVMREEGAIMLPILLGAVLGTRRAWEQDHLREASPMIQAS